MFCEFSYLVIWSDLSKQCMYCFHGLHCGFSLQLGRLYDYRYLCHLTFRFVYGKNLEEPDYLKPVSNLFSS